MTLSKRMEKKEAVRLAALERLGAVAPETDGVLQGISDDVRELFGTDLCVLHLMLADSLYFRAWSGPLPEEFVESREIKAEQSMCPNVILSESPLIVEDLSASERFRDHFVCAVAGLRFYAGVPLVTSGGETIGSLCLLGVKPREFGDTELATLSAFARAAVGRLELLSALSNERAAREEEKERERELRRVLDESLDMITTVAFDGTVRAMNRACMPVLGYRPEELVGRRYLDMVHPDDREKGMEAAKRLYSGEAVALFESRYLKKDGGVAWIEWSATPHPDEGVYHCVARDVTERRRAEDELRRQRDLYATLLDAQSAVGEGFIVLEGERIVYANEAFAGMSGYKVEELETLTTFFDLLPPEERVASREKMGERLAGRLTDEYLEATLLHRSGRRVDLELGLKMLRIDGRARFVLVGRDVTERRRGEAERLRLSDDMRLLLESTGEGIYGMDCQGRCTFINRSASAMLGFEPEEVLGRNIHALIHHSRPDGTPFPEKECPIFLALDTGEECRVEDSVFWRRDGTPVVVEYSSRPMTENGEKRGAVVTFSDVEKRREAEKNLRESEERYRTLVEHVPAVNYTLMVAPEGVVGSMTNGALSYLSPRVEMLLGFPPEAFLGDPGLWTALIHPDDLTVVLREDERTDRTGDPFSMEYRMRHRDGRWVWVRDESVLVHGGDRRAMFWQCFLTDVTKRREAEETLRESEERHRLVAETASDAIITINDKSEILSVNRAAEETFGYPSSRLLGQKLTMLMPHHLREAHEAGLRRYLATGEKNLGWDSIELPGLHASGRHVSLEVSFGEWAEGGERRFTGFIRDVTDRKDAEGALRRAEEKYRSIFENTVEGIFQSTPDGRFLTVNPAMARILGFDSPEDLIEKVSDIGKQLFVDYMRRNEMVEQISRHGSVTDFVSRARRKDGAVIWVSANARLRYGENGEPVGYEGTLEDVTERKRLEEELLGSERRFKGLVEQAADAIFVHDREGKFVDVNQRACNASGYSREELLSMSVQDVEAGITPETLDDLWEAVDRGETVTVEGNQLRKDGTSFPTEVRIGGFEWDGRKLILALARDITERRRAEESRAQFRAVFEKAPMGMTLADAEGRITAANPSFREMLGYGEEELIGMHFDEITHPEYVDESQGLMDKLVAGEIKGYKLEKRYIKKDGEELWGRLTVSEMREDGEFRYCVAMVEDITEQRAFQDRLAYLASHDSLTGLPNRALLSNRLEASLARGARTGLHTALLYLDLDDFKAVNDTLGHEAGDELLVEISRRLESCLRTEDTAARLGGDEFAVLLENVPDARFVSRVVERVVDSLSVPFRVHGHEFPLGTSVGSAVSEPGERSPASLLREADRAMYCVKARRKSDPSDATGDAISDTESDADPFRARVFR